MPRGKSDVCLSRKGRKARSKVLFNGVCLFVANEGLAGYKFGQIRQDWEIEGFGFWGGGGWGGCGPGYHPLIYFLLLTLLFSPLHHVTKI